MVKNKLLLCKEYHLQPSEIDRFVYYEYEWILEEINLIQKQQEEDRENQQDQLSDMRRSFNSHAMTNAMSNSMPKMSDFKMPTVHMPSFSK